MNFEKPSKFNNNEDSNKIPKKNSSESLEKKSDVIELDLSEEDFGKLINLKERIDSIQTSNYNKSEKFRIATEKFLDEIEDEFETGKIEDIASITLLKGEGISERATEFDFNDEKFSVSEFVKSFE